MKIQSAHKQFFPAATLAWTASLLVGTVWADATDPTDNHEHHYFHKKEKEDAPQWGYEGKLGPSFWAKLSPRFQLAATGKRQSPIDLAEMAKTKLPPIKFNYKPCKIRLVYNGHTIEEMEEKGSSITVDGKDYELKQFHFHSPSEHTLHGKHFDMEMHLVHMNDDGEIAVIGVFIQQGDANAWFGPVWDYLPSKENKNRNFELNINVEDALPPNRDYTSYSGSLTTPPCTEDVKWMILKRPIELSKRQIDAFRKTIDGNNRPVQPLNKRVVYTE